MVSQYHFFFSNSVRVMHGSCMQLYFSANEIGNQFISVDLLPMSLEWLFNTTVRLVGTSSYFNFMQNYTGWPQLLSGPIFCVKTNPLIINPLSGP